MATSRQSVGAPRRRSLATLNDELLLMVLEKLQEASDRQAWCLVCKSFRDLEAGVRTRVQLLKVELLAPVLRRFSRLEQLDLSLTQKVTDDSLFLVGKHAGATLRSINLTKASGFGEAGIFELARSCRSLEAVNVSNCTHLTDASLLALSQMRGLKELHLLACRRLTDVGLGCLAAGCNDLRFLNLKCCVRITDMGVIMVASCCKRLHTLDLSFTEVTNKCLESVSALTHLENLRLVRCTNIDDDGLTLLRSNCKSLQKLDISKCPSVTNVGLMSLAVGNTSLQHLAMSHRVQASEELLATLHKFSNLQVVWLDGCEVTADGLAFIGRGCSSLKELSLSKCIGVTDHGMEAVVSRCTGLHKIDLTCCREITDVSLSHLTNSCKDLRVLRMESCSLVTDAGLGLLGLGCPMLEELDLTDTAVTDAGVKSVSRCSSLRLLKLGICLNISDAGVEHIGANCRNLREIDFYRSVGVGDAGVAAIAAGCRRLKTVTLSYCTRVTDNAMRALSLLSELHTIEIRACNQVTCSGLASIAIGCKRVTQLDIKHCVGISDAGILAIVTGCPNIRQINASYCHITNVGILALGNVNCLLNLKIIYMKNVALDCYERVLLACRSLKKVKLLSQLSKVIPGDVVDSVEKRGCRIRWMTKAFNPVHL